MVDVLILSPYGDLIEDTVRATGCTPIIRSEITEISDWPDSDWVISFGYRKIIGKPTIDRFQKQIINIHMSLLPWNRGADPNFWSWFDDTPKGVSIHYIVPQIDDGQIINQMALGTFDFRFGVRKTLKTTYDDLQIAAAGLFKRTWPDLIKGSYEPKRLTPWNVAGSYHGAADKDKFIRFIQPLKLLDTPVEDIQLMGDLYSGKKWGKK